MKTKGLTRLQSLTNGINGMNSPLKHITVLEEAHNLSRRTSLEQSSESANLLGKSVEMLANAIAEMRTFGEGFVIVDHATGLLDLSTIRNTNTKIIMRLPDLSDRELVGRAANLNDDQITELAKLPCGVVAVCQNEWARTCCPPYTDAKYMGEEKTFLFSPKQGADVYTQTNHVTTSLLDCIMNKEIFRKGDRFDAHHLQPLNVGGKNEVSNITPLHAEVHFEHSGVHITDGPCDRMCKMVGGMEK